VMLIGLNVEMQSSTYKSDDDFKSYASHDFLREPISQLDLSSERNHRPKEELVGLKAGEDPGHHHLLKEQGDT
jgi:hypothetical protein